ncbi:uncharacterized protein LOC143248211 [Tachypleus tridentatus]|uniref:uncharacterized protein LOC143248211 n=1 Tax=Tachypleus tridentatus TaxID=6853 RepID=UPI003FD65099
MDRKRLVRLETWKFDHIWKKPSVANGVGLREVIHAVTTIEDFVDTTIVLKKDNNELGISVTGGNDTCLVNDMSLRDIFFKEAVKLLRETASPVRPLVVIENR